MGKYDFLAILGLVGVAGYLGYHFFIRKDSAIIDFTDIGGSISRGIAGLEAGIGGYDDPFDFYQKEPEAFDPTSKRYREIVEKSRSAQKQKIDKKKQLVLIESYLADAYSRY